MEQVTSNTLNYTISAIDQTIIKERIPPTAAILTIGSELMLGQMADTNSAWLSNYLSEKGVNVVRHVSVGDNLPVMIDLLADSFRDYEVTVVTGGLGPTEDDLTRLAVSRAMGRPLVYHPILARNLFDYITARGYNFSENNYRQSWLPDGCALVENPWGTAPAFCQEARNRVMLFTPGVPQEMKNIVEYFLGPKLEEKFPSRLGYHRTTILRASGLGESRVDYLLGDLIRDSVNPVLGLLAGPYETRILITSKARDKAEADRLEAPIIAEAIKRLGPNYVGRDGQTMVTSVCEALKNQSLRLGIIDGVTFGEAAQTFLKLLPPQNLAGTLEVAADGQKVKEGTDFLFKNLGADLVGILSYPESFLSQGTIQDEDTEITVNIRLLKRNPTEELPIEVAQDTILVGRTKAAALSRASALLALKLYTYLRNLPY